MASERGAARWLRAALVALLLGALAPGWCAAEAALQVIDRALFVGADGRAVAVALPDTWALRELPMAGAGRYRLVVHLEEAPRLPQSLYAPRMSPVHALRVNGVEVLERGVHGRRPRPEPQLLAIPAGLLRAGANELELSVQYTIRGGLSPLWLGPAGEVEAVQRRADWLESRLPQGLNLLGVAFAGVMALVAWQRRRDDMLRVFAALTCLACSRNLAYYEQGVGLPQPWSDMAFFALQLLTGYLLARFALALTQTRWPRYRRVLRRVLALALLAGLAAGLAGEIVLARRWLYPVLIVLLLPALFLLTRHAWRQRGAALALVALGAGSVLAAGVHDYLYSLGHLAITGRLWLPFATPVFLVLFGAAHLRQLLRLFARGEAMNRLLQQRVAQRTAELQRANAVKARFLAVAGHDLRQPITAVNLMVGLARQRAVDPQQAAQLDRAQQGLESLQGFMTGLLDLSRLNGGALSVRVDRLPLQTLFDELDLHFAPQARANRRLRLRPSALAVASDRLLLSQVLRNLCSNALQHADRVLVAARRRGDEVWVEVWDTGPGIPPEQQQSVFEEFVRLPARPGDAIQPGWGLGLSIVQQSLQRLGHALELDSRVGRGTRFRVRLPAA